MKTYFYIIVFGCLAFSACHSSRNANHADSSPQYFFSSPVSELREDKYIERENKAENREQKLTYTTTLNIAVDSAAPAKIAATAIAKTHGGYMLESRDFVILFKIPAQNLAAALTDFKKTGKVTSEYQSAKDVTDEYYDIPLRLESAEKSRDRYLALLKAAKDVNEVLLVEKELERINEKIESYKGTIKSLEKRIDFATVTIIFEQKAGKPKPGPIGYVFVGLFKAVKWLFVRG